MTRLHVTNNAKADISATIDFLEKEAGRATAAKYARRFQDAIGRLVKFPESGAPRGSLGEFIRGIVVYPYIVLYEYQVSSDLLIILRVLHGKTDIKPPRLHRR
jgi:plasmid stabilization system protein ParE